MRLHITSSCFLAATVLWAAGSNLVAASPNIDVVTELEARRPILAYMQISTPENTPATSSIRYTRRSSQPEPELEVRRWGGAYMSISSPGNAPATSSIRYPRNLQEEPELEARRNGGAYMQINGAGNAPTTSPIGYPRGIPMETLLQARRSDTAHREGGVYMAISGSGSTPILSSVRSPRDSQTSSPCCPKCAFIQMNNPSIPASSSPIGSPRHSQDGIGRSAHGFGGAYVQISTNGNNPPMTHFRYPRRRRGGSGIETRQTPKSGGAYVQIAPSGNAPATSSIRYPRETEIEMLQARRMAPAFMQIASPGNPPASSAILYPNRRDMAAEIVLEPIRHRSMLYPRYNSMEIEEA